MQILLSVALWCLFGSLSAYYANQKGRDPITWFVIGILLGIFGLIVLYFLPKVENTEKQEEEMINEAELSQIPPQISSEPHCRFKDWFYLDQGRNQKGPVAFDGLKKLWNTGLLNESSLVWSEGMGEWKKIQDIPDLSDCLR